MPCRLLCTTLLISKGIRARLLCCRPPAHILCLGNSCFSNIRVLIPLPASRYPRRLPEGPAPEIITSYLESISINFIKRKSKAQQINIAVPCFQYDISGFVPYMYAFSVFLSNRCIISRSMYSFALSPLLSFDLGETRAVISTPFMST